MICNFVTLSFSMSSKQEKLRIVWDVAMMFGAGASIYYMLSFLLNQGSGPIQSKATKKKAEASLKRLRLQNPEVDLDLDEYERTVLASVVGPSEINVTFKDIGGLDPIIQELRESVLYPLTAPDLYSQLGPLLEAPKGVLLYGPPGCGKTMLAKALASESGANFISIKMSTIMDKWFGESNKIVAAIFSLASKLRPCIIFIDEIDSFLRERSSSDHEITAMLKAEFMTLWDGLTSDGGVLVLGATNRPNDIDSAILRRMPKKFEMLRPDRAQRDKILRKILKDMVVDNFDYNALVDKTSGFSGSDLKELCRDAAVRATREMLRKNFTKDGVRVNTSAPTKLRKLRTEDFLLSDGASAETLPFNIVPESAPTLD